MLSSIFLKTQHGGFPTLRPHDKIHEQQTNPEPCKARLQCLPQTTADMIDGARPKA